MKKQVLSFILVLLCSLAIAQPQLVSQLPANPSYFASIGDDLYFAIEDEFWTSDGRQAGTRMVCDLNEDIVDIRVDDEKVFIITYNSGYKLYQSNGELAGTILLRDLPFTSKPHEFKNLNGVSFFIADTDLWITDGSLAGTMIFEDLNLGSNPVDKYPILNIYNGYFYYASNNIIWRINENMTASEVVLNIINFPRKLENSRMELAGIIGATNNKLIFATYYQDYDTDEIDLYSSNGLIGDTTFIIKIDLADRLGYIKVFGNSIIFSPEFATVYNPVWITDGSTSGTQRLFEDVGLDSFISDILVLENYAILVVVGQGNNLSLWKTDGTESNSKYYLPILAYGSYFRKIAGIGSTLFFPDRSDNIYDWDRGDSELWQSELSSQNTFLVRDLTASPFDTYAGTNNLINVNDILYFSTDSTDSEKARLWKYCPPFLTSPVSAIAEQSNLKLTAYPNPFSDKLYLENCDSKTITFTNTLGEVVHKEEQYSGSISLSHLPIGIYFVDVDGKERVFKIIKQR